VQVSFALKPPSPRRLQQVPTRLNETACLKKIGCARSPKGHLNLTAYEFIN
jgi:hypothetical protein